MNAKLKNKQELVEMQKGALIVTIFKGKYQIALLIVTVYCSKVGVRSTC